MTTAPFRKTARLLLYVATASGSALVPFHAAAQQVASGPDYSQCDKIADGLQFGHCRLDASIAHSKERIKAADTKIANATATIAAGEVKIALSEAETRAAKDAIGCSAELKELAKDKGKQERGRALLLAAGQGVAQYGACRLRDQLKNE
ncbi:MAG: hypothetical protein ABL982_17545 [Vicinamibacterales bacterium]